MVLSCDSPPSMFDCFVTSIEPSSTCSIVGLYYVIVLWIDVKLLLARLTCIWWCISRSISKLLILVAQTGRHGIRKVNQSRLSFWSFVILPIFTLKAERELPDMWSSVRLSRFSIPSGSSVSLLSDTDNFSNFLSSLVERVRFLSLFYESFSTRRLFLS